ncbi:MAG: nucleoside 2-deoxyribosyltransferase domain-containing protein [bacterium]
MTVVYPPDIKRISGPLIFLAGPIQGAPDWQSLATTYIQSKNAGLHIASPRTPPPWHGRFDEQVDWEHYHLRYASGNGVVMFWLAKEEEHVCERAYAQTSRFELGWHMARYMLEDANVVVGIEKGFSGEQYLRHTLLRQASGIPVLTSLENTCDVAINLARSA